MDLTFADWRIAAVALIALLGGYLLWASLRLSRMKKHATEHPPESPPPPPAPPPLVEEVPTQTSTLAASSLAPPPADAAGFALRHYMSGVEAELEQIRGELAELRNEVSRLKSARPTSPHYTEAMSLAARGADAQTVADECGISLGEAELVLALSRRESKEGRLS